MTQSTTKLVALVTGGNRSIGLAICKQLVSKNFHVLMGTRTLSKGENAIKTNFKSNDTIEPLLIDVNSQESVDKAQKYVSDTHKRIDVIVNNAAIIFETEFNADVVRKTFNTNFYGAQRVSQSFLSLLSSNNGRVINISSRVGRFSKITDEKKRNQLLQFDKIKLSELNEFMESYIKAVARDDDKNDKYKLEDEGWARTAYGMSKIGLSTYSRILARDNPKIFVANVCPGFVNTTMNNNKGPRSIDQGGFIASYFSDVDLKNYKSGHFYAAEFDDKDNDWQKNVKVEEQEYVNPKFAH